MGTTTTRQRRDYLRAVLANAQSSGDPVAPWQRLGGVETAFTDESDLLVELHREWLRVLVGRLHRGGVVAQRTPGNVRDLYDEVRATHPTLRGILDAHREAPALREAAAREHAMLARVAGLLHDTAVDTTGDATGDTAAEASALGHRLVGQRIPVQQQRAAHRS